MSRTLSRLLRDRVADPQAVTQDEWSEIIAQYHPRRTSRMCLGVIAIHKAAAKSQTFKPNGLRERERRMRQDTRWLLA